MRTLIYKSDEGCRKGCHPVFILRVYRGKIEEVRYFSVDEPGAWWDEEWNCHVDGCDYPCKSRQEAIEKGARFKEDVKTDYADELEEGWVYEDGQNFCEVYNDGWYSQDHYRAELHEIELK